MSSTQIDKKYGTDWAKSKSRDLVRGMIQRNLGYKKPQDLRVLCFPGNEAAEIREVYDPLGIPRGNIVGVERDKDVADKIRAQNLGIQVVNQTLEDYVAEQDSLDFDIVSSDYTGPPNPEQIQTLEFLMRKQIIGRYFVHQANLAKRDGNNSAHYILSGRLATQIGLSKVDGRSIEEMKEDVLVEFEKGADLTGGESVRDYRPLAYSIVLRNLLSGGPSGDETSLERIRQFVIMSFGQTDKNKYMSREVTEFISIHLMDAFCKALFKQGFKDRTLLHIAASAFIQGIDSPISAIKDSEMYSYVSESGAPMIGDIYFMERMPQLSERSRNIRRMIGYPNRLILKNRTQLEGKIREVIPDLFNFTKLFLISADKARDRQFLGSSARPVLTKQRAIEEFRNGATVDEVRDKYRGVNGKPLAQWKAHVTMGTYNPQVKSSDSEEEIIENTEDSDLEKITKEQAIELLSTGIPPKEIFEAYPTSFTKGQLAAFKAWITMR